MQALGYSPSLTGKCIRTILHLIAWLSANGMGIERLDIRVLHRFLNHDCACPGPHGYRKNLERARWHLLRFLGFLMETGRVRMPAEIENGGRVVESFLQTLTAQGYVPESIAAYRVSVPGGRAPAAAIYRSTDGEFSYDRRARCVAAEIGAKR